MRARDLGYVVLKLFSIYFIARGIGYLWRGVIVWSEHLRVPQSLLFFDFFKAALLFEMAHFTWFYTPKIVKYLFPTGNEMPEKKNRQLKAKDLQTAAFTVVGIVIVFQAILYLSNLISYLIMITTRTEITLAMKSVKNFAATLLDAEHFLKITGILIYLIIGIALIVWGKQFSRFVSQINPGAVTLAQKLRLLLKAEKPVKRDSEKIQEG